MCLKRAAPGGTAPCDLNYSSLRSLFVFIRHQCHRLDDHRLYRHVAVGTLLPRLGHVDLVDDIGALDDLAEHAVAVLCPGLALVVEARVVIGVDVISGGLLVPALKLEKCVTLKVKVKVSAS